MISDPFLSIGTIGLLYALILPILLLQLLAFLFIPSILTAGARSLSVGKAIYSFLMQGLGIIMMSMGALPSLFSVLSSQVVGAAAFSTNTYLGLLIVFAVGGLIFLMHEHLARTIDEPSRAIPYAIYFFTFKIIGFVATLFGCLTLLLSMLFGVASITPGWWIMPVIILVYGLILSYCTRLDTLGLSPQKVPVPRPAPTPAAAMIARATPPDPVPSPSKPIIPGKVLTTASMVAAAKPAESFSATTGSNLTPPKADEKASSAKKKPAAKKKKA